MILQHQQPEQQLPNNNAAYKSIKATSSGDIYFLIEAAFSVCICFSKKNCTYKIIIKFL